MRRTASREPSQNHPLPVMDPSPQKRGSYAMGSSEVDGTPGPLSLPRFDEFDREPRAELDDEGDDDDDFVDGTPPP